MSPARLPVVVAGALVLQLTLAAGALAGPWALEPAPRAVPAVPPVAVQAAAPAGPVVLASELWPGERVLAPLGVDASGALEVPATAQQLGWWSAGPRPGEPGAAVVVGHVDLDGEPGVFSRLGEAAPGAVVVAGGVRFRVASVERYSKQAFPTDLVYRPSVRAELRLITCGGRFDPRTGHYEDNVVVRAVRA